MKILFNTFKNNNLSLNQPKKNSNIKTSSVNSSKTVTYPKNYYVSFGAFKETEFKKAKTIKEAQIYGRKQLGVIEYTGFDESSLDTINFINEGLFAIKSKAKNLIRLPRYIDLKEIRNAQMSTNYFLGGTLTVNEKIYHPNSIKKEIERIYSELKRGGIFVQEEIPVDFDELDYVEKIDFYNKIRITYEQTSQLNKFPKYLLVKMLEAGCWGDFSSADIELFEMELNNVSQEDNFKILYEFLRERNMTNFNFRENSFRNRTIFHEVGHLQSYEIFYMPDASDFSSYNNCSIEMRKWLDDKDTLQTAFKVSPYACFGAPEFVAETYALLLEGRELPKDVQKLYKKLKGPKVVLRHS